MRTTELKIWKKQKVNKKKKKASKIEESKLYMRWILGSSIICIFLSYVLAFCGREQIAEGLSKSIVINIIGTFAVYSVKAFFGKKNEADNEIKRMKLEDDCDDGFDSNM